MVRVWLDGFAIEFSRNKEGAWVAFFARFPNLSASGGKPEDALAELGMLWKLVRQNYIQSSDAVPIAKRSCR